MGFQISKGNFKAFLQQPNSCFFNISWGKQGYNRGLFKKYLQGLKEV